MKKSELRKLIKEAIAAPAATGAVPGATAPVSSDVKQLQKARTSSTTISNANKRINNVAELQQAFKGWITTLGIQSGAGTEQGKTKVPYGTLIATINKALKELSWK